MNILRTGNSWKSSEISSTQNSDINNFAVVQMDISTIKGSQSTQDSATNRKKNKPIVYFLSRVPSECFLECGIAPKSLKNLSIDKGLSAVSVEDSSIVNLPLLSSKVNLSLLETAITVTD